MELSYNWLKDYVKTGQSPEKISEFLTMSGSEVGSMMDVNGDTVMELEITSNRPDCLNMIGLSREVSAVLDKDLILPDMKFTGTELEGSGITCVIKNRKLCPFYSARVIKDITIAPVSDNIGKKILSVGMRNVNNVVDVTNFCLMETGQPLHAFDLDRISGSRIYIREAEEGETIITIDNVERKLKKGMLIIADEKGPVAVAGVMGGKNTEVTGTTKNILLESAYFDPISVRRTARALGLSSDSSYRFERGVDKGMVAPASDRAAMLILKEAGGTAFKIDTAGSIEAKKISFGVSIQKTEKILGIPLDKERTIKKLNRLGFVIGSTLGDEFTIEVPSHREDVRSDTDVVEEIARITGYDKIPAKFEKIVPQITRKETARKIDEKIKNLISAMGFQEIMTYSLVGERTAGILSLFEGVKNVSLINPLSEDQKTLTVSLVDGMLRSISWNLNRKNRDLSLFETGKAYYTGKGSGQYTEIPILCMAMTGEVNKGLKDKKRSVDFYDLKGAVEELMKGLKINARYYKKKMDGTTVCAGIKLASSGEETGFIGQVSRKLLQKYDIEEPVFAAQIDLARIASASKLDNRYEPVPKFPFSSRDIAVLCDEALTAGEMIDAVLGVKNDMVQSAEVIDIYRGEQIGPGKKSVTINISYGLKDRTLTEEEIRSANTEVKNALLSGLKVSFR